VLRGGWAGYDGKVLAVEEAGALVVEFNDAATRPLQILDAADCGVIMLLSTMDY